MSFLAFLDRFALPRFRRPVVSDVEGPLHEMEVVYLLHRNFLGPLIEAQMKTGNFDKLCRDAMRMAVRENRPEDATLYRNMLAQVSDYYSQT